MRRSWILAAAGVLILTGLAGCGGREQPAAAPLVTQPTTVEPRAEEVPQPAAPSITEDQTPHPLEADLQRANEYARQEGLLGDVFFDFDKYDLKSEARERLAKNAQFLNSRPEFIVTIEGHCDERGTNEYNLALGERRSNAARDYLSSLGVADARVSTISYGEERPVCTQSDEACWAQNRRAHFVITGRSG